MLWKIKPKKAGQVLFVVWWLLTALSLPILLSCADEGAGGFTELNGIWNGTFQEGGIPSGLIIQPLAHSQTGSMSLNISTDDQGNITGMATMTPDICAEELAETGMTVMAAITGMLLGNSATFKYTSNFISPPQDVVFSVQIIFDPMTGFYDGSKCSPTWTGGFKLTKQS